MPDRILRLNKVQERTGLCRSGVFAGMKNGTFPRSFRLGNTRAVGWSEVAVQKWIDDTVKLAARDNSQQQNDLAGAA